jgi:endonuclease YncB( thermonuclease family)
MIGFGVRAAFVAVSLTATAAQAEPVETGRVIWITDGDTFRLESGEAIRIAEIDAAETQPGNAKCRAEIVRGRAATQRTIALLKDRMVTFERVGRSYNRTVARVWLGGRDLAGVLVEAGVAQWWPRGNAKPDWCR